MNRRERRNMQKQLGLTKHYKNETRAAKFDRWKDNQENGRRIMSEREEKDRVSIQEQMDEKQSNKTLHKAETIAQSKGIPLMDAISEAQ